MVDNSASQAAHPRLNPFLFPSETTFRFILLLVALSGATLFIYHWLYFRIPSLRAQLDQAILQCFERLRDAPLPIPGKVTLASSECIAPTFRQQALFDLAGLGLTLVITVIIYWVYPKIVIRRRDLKPLSVVDAPGLAEALHQLCRDVGLQRAPTFMIDIRNDADGGIAFGRWGRYYVRLDAGLLHKFLTDRPLFDAVVRHELAHLRNADISMTYLALIGWWAFLVSALVVFAYDLLVWPADTLTTLKFAWRFALILLLVYWARNAILRVRELYADARAYQSDAASGALARVFERGGGEHNRLSGLFGFHPAAVLRRAALEKPEWLFRISLLEAAAVGAAIGIALPMVAFTVGQILRVELSLWTSLLGLLVFVPFLVGGLGLGVWREIYASVTLGKRSSDAGRFGIVVGIGFLVGLQVSPVPFMLSSEILPLSLGTRALTAGAMLLFLFLLFRWIATGAKAWVEAVNSPVSLRRAYSSGLIIATILMAIGCHWLWLFGGTLMRVAEITQVPMLGLITDPGVVLPFLQKVQTTVFLICLWAFPVAADWWRSRRASTTSTLQYMAPAAATHQAARRETRAALLGGVYCALVFLILYVPARLTLQTWLVDPSERWLFYINTVLVAGVAQACLAAYIAWRSQRLSVLYGLFAAFVAGCLMATVLVITGLLVSGSTDLGFVWVAFTNLVNLGAIFALPLAFVASIRFRPTPPTKP